MGHIIEYGKIGIDKDKLRAIKEWRAPTSVTKLHFFLELTNYYHRFIEGFLRRVAPLAELFKKDFALEGILTQEGHPIAYRNRLNSAERRYTVSEKEMLVVVHYLSQPKLTSKKA
ncbi:reverse transcriptase [Cucumis melo var. makuwa]|uniref:Reverse transcriptase n=1 Tax=Cucumis melo var. makuwa TaxID=1194695 RepID=A0A5A7STJ6_CUCMM|nr:reverse transcriptase [Cucumis melo var. makuwa]TYK21864.1 reverse transcriptase [Cucumis melo var. makuwa]